MEKLFLLPLILLLLNCSGTKNNQEGSKDQKEMEQPISIGSGAQQPEEGDATDTQEQTQEQNINIEQGIAGKIVWQSGNQMPSPDAPVRSGKRGVKRTVYIYELTKVSQATIIDGVFHTNIQTKLVTQVVTDANGSFTVSLEPGNYSVFTKEEKGLYANLFDGEGNIFPVKVKKGEVTIIEFLINYNATY